MFQQNLLKFKISDWRQLTDVKSNNSNKLNIAVSEFVQDKRLSGLRIELKHDDFGTLFACVLGAQGSIIDEVIENMVPELTPTQILIELQKYGYHITYTPEKQLPIPQLQHLYSIKGLGFDKLRILYVHSYSHGIKQIKWYVVAFNVKDNPDWINNSYSPSHPEFIESLNNGSAVNLSMVSNTKKYRWDWLVDWVADIDDILEANA
jgi:hypothetical protein